MCHWWCFRVWCSERHLFPVVTKEIMFSPASVSTFSSASQGVSDFLGLDEEKKIRPIRVAGVSDWVQFVSVFSNFYFSKHIWQQNRRKMMKNKTVWMIVKQFNNFSCYSGDHKSRVISNALLYTVNNIVTTHVWYITFKKKLAERWSTSQTSTFAPCFLFTLGERSSSVATTNACLN